MEISKKGFFIKDILVEAEKTLCEGNLILGNEDLNRFVDTNRVEKNNEGPAIDYCQINEKNKSFGEKSEKNIFGEKVSMDLVDNKYEHFCSGSYKSCIPTSISNSEKTELYCENLLNFTFRKFNNFTESFHHFQSHCLHSPYALKTRKRDKKARRPRTNFTDYQLHELEALFIKQKYLNVQERTELAERLHLNELQIKTWYQNRRTKWKRQTSLCMNIMPPGNLLFHHNAIHSVTPLIKPSLVSLSIFGSSVNQLQQPFQMQPQQKDSF